MAIRVAPSLSERLYLRVEEAAALTGESRSTMYRRVRSGEIPSVKVGGNRRISRAALRAWAERVELEQNPPAA